MNHPNYACMSPDELRVAELAAMSELRLIRVVMDMKCIKGYRRSKAENHGPVLHFKGIVGNPSTLDALKCLRNIAGGQIISLKDAKDIVDAVREGTPTKVDFGRALEPVELREIRQFFHY